MATATRKKKESSKKAVPSGKGLTFEKVGAMMQETDRQSKENSERFNRELKERDEQFNRELKESAERLDRELKERDERFDREMKERSEQFNRELKERDERLNKQLGRLGNRFGEAIEHMVMPNLVQKFRELGFVFYKAYPRADIEDFDHKIFVEIDITLENGDKGLLRLSPNQPLKA
jgi:hypothetical protein